MASPDIDERIDEIAKTQHASGRNIGFAVGFASGYVAGMEQQCGGEIPEQKIQRRERERAYRILADSAPWQRKLAMHLMKGNVAMEEALGILDKDRRGEW